MTKRGWNLRETKTGLVHVSLVWSHIHICGTVYIVKWRQNTKKRHRLEWEREHAFEAANRASCKPSHVLKCRNVGVLSYFSLDSLVLTLDLPERTNIRCKQTDVTRSCSCAYCSSDCSATGTWLWSWGQQPKVKRQLRVIANHDCDVLHETWCSETRVVSLSCKAWKFYSIWHYVIRCWKRQWTTKACTAW